MRIEEKEDKLVIVDFNELEAYKIASKIEEDGIRFYERLTEGVRDENIKGRLRFLLEEERKHLIFFKESLYRMQERTEDAFEEDNLLSYIDYAIFQPYQSIDDMADKIDDVKKALRLGVIVEEKSIKFYQACKDNISSAQTESELQNIINEENRHKALLESILNELKK
jgi:rubrerythrin